MRKVVVGWVIAVAVWPGLAQRAAAWGPYGHELVNEFAVDNLPDAMYDDGSGNSFKDWREFLGDHASDPDALRSSGRDPNESPRHFCDIDSRLAQYPAPFDTVPRDYSGYVSAFGRSNGVVMWEGCAEHTDGLRIALKTRNWAAAKQAAADLGHYVADSHSPLHGTANYNGQLTGNGGIHSRHESVMVNLFVTASDIVTRRSPVPLPGTTQYISDQVEFSFDMIVQSQALVQPIMDADTAARTVDPSYGFTYYQELFDSTGAFTIAQLNDGAMRLADMWYTAWVDAGSPDFDAEPIALAASAAATMIDGNLAEYGGGAVLQTNTTEAVDNGNELDQLFLGNDAAYLYLGVAGNLAANNALIVLLDTKSGGSSTLPNTGPGYLAFLSGTALDTGLRPDYALTFERQPSGDVVSLVNLQAMTTSTLSEAGGSAAIDNANVGGVKNRAGRIVGDCENVRTGIEVSIPLAWLGIPAGAGGEVRLLALTTSTAATPFVSGQFLPGMPLGAFEVGSSPRPFDFRSRSYARFALTPTPPSTGWMIQ